MTGGTGVRTRPYQRRRRLPIAIVVSMLAVIAIATWSVVLVSAASGSGGGKCPAPAAGPAIGESLASGALDTVAPTAPSSVAVRVTNGGDQRGQANLVAAQLGELGFAQAAPPTNDPFFPDGGMDCIGQIRFGAAGDRGASTLALLLPCVELVRDSRADNTVDVAIGTGFRDVNPPKAVRDALSHLTAPAGGTDGATDPTPGAQPGGDPATLQAARASGC